MGWKLYFKLLKEKGTEKLKGFNSMDKFKLDEPFDEHFYEIKKLLEKNVVRSSGIMILYKEVERIESILLNDKGYVREKYKPLMLSYVEIFDTLRKAIPNELNYDLSQDLYKKLVEIMYYISEDILSVANGEKSKERNSDLKPSGIESMRKASSLDKLDKNLEKIKIIKNKDERESELYKWLMLGEGPDLNPTTQGVVNKSVADALNELKEMKNGNLSSNNELDESNKIFTDELFTIKEESDEDVIETLKKELARDDLSDSQRRKLEHKLGQAEGFRKLLDKKINDK